MTSHLHHMTQTKHKNRQTMETRDTCFCGESFIDRSFLVLEILRGHFVHSPPLPWPKNPMLNRVKKLLIFQEEFPKPEYQKMTADLVCIPNVSSNEFSAF